MCMLFHISVRREMQSRKSSLNSRFVSLKALQIPKHCTVADNTVSQGFTTAAIVITFVTMIGS